MSVDIFTIFKMIKYLLVLILWHFHFSKHGWKSIPVQCVIDVHSDVFPFASIANSMPFRHMILTVLCGWKQIQIFLMNSAICPDFIWGVKLIYPLSLPDSLSGLLSDLFVCTHPFPLVLTSPLWELPPTDKGIILLVILLSFQHMCFTNSGDERQNPNIRSVYNVFQRFRPRINTKSKHQ